MNPCLQTSGSACQIREGANTPRLRKCGHNKAYNAAWRVVADKKTLNAERGTANLVPFDGRSYQLGVSWSICHLVRAL
jgi:hypothetical protein